MNNRFIKRIKSGEIDSIVELKTEFKQLAKLTHPDLSISTTNAEQFMRIRGEYEDALRDFERHRFGFQGTRVPAVFDRKTFYSTLVVLFKRGFPKVPRHEKEKHKYEYHRYLARTQLGAWKADHAPLFDAFERDLLRLKGGASREYDRILDLVLEIFEFHEKGIPLMKKGIELGFRSLRKDSEAHDAVEDFLSLLIDDMKKGAAFR